MKTRFALILTMFVMAVGCVHRNARNTLMEADRMVNEQPDSAIQHISYSSRNLKI